MSVFPSPRLCASLSTLVAVSLLTSPGFGQQKTAPPIARYTMDASTTSGLAAMGQGMGGAMSMMFGGGNKEIRQLTLRLGSTRTPTGGAAKADHFLPPETKLGKSVPLITPTSVPGLAREYEPKQTPFERPKGRLLIYWGCGATAPKGQPVVIDFAKVAEGQFPPGLFTQTTALPPDWQLNPGNNKTYGDWPNPKDNKPIKRDASLLGAHKIVSNYAPEISFQLTQDFMPAITGQSAETPTGAIQLAWNGIANATGYYAWVFGMNPGPDGKANDMVWWASSATQQFGGPLWDWLPPSTVQKLIAQKTVMPPTQTSCTVPAEVKKAGGQVMMGNLYAYGPQVDLAYPPRPADPKVMWKPDWTTRVRYRSNTMWMLGSPMGAAMNEGGQQQQPARKKCKGGLGGILAGAAGLGC